jgi:hypothetical protein
LFTVMRRQPSDWGAQDPRRDLWHSALGIREEDTLRTGGAMTQPITMQIFSDYV